MWNDDPGDPASLRRSAWMIPKLWSLSTISECAPAACTAAFHISS